MLYRERNPKFIEAKQFLTLNEDMIYLGLSELPEQYKNGTCQLCGKAMAGHGNLNGNLVCPGTYLLMANGQVTNLMSQVNFEQLYVPFIIASEDENDKDN